MPSAKGPEKGEVLKKEKKMKLNVREELRKLNVREEVREEAREELEVYCDDCGCFGCEELCEGAIERLEKIERN